MGTRTPVRTPVGSISVPPGSGSSSVNTPCSVNTKGPLVPPHGLGESICQQIRPVHTSVSTDGDLQSQTSGFATVPVPVLVESHPPEHAGARLREVLSPPVPGRQPKNSQPAGTSDQKRRTSPVRSRTYERLGASMPASSRGRCSGNNRNPALRTPAAFNQVSASGTPGSNRSAMSLVRQ